MQNFIRFHAIESEIELPQEFWKTRNSSASCKAICTKIAPLLFLVTYILDVNIFAISFTRNGNQRILKISEKEKLQRHLLSDFHQKLMNINLCLDNTKYKISLIFVH